MNKSILLSVKYFDWYFSKATYTCSIDKAIALTPFDKVICSILARKGQSMRYVELASLLGFNVIDDASNNRYRDKSEWNIFVNELEDLKSFKLVTTSFDETVQLTENGYRAVREGRKYTEIAEEIELLQDMFHNDTIAKQLFADVSCEQVEFPKESMFDDLLGEPSELLNAQYPELINPDMGNKLRGITQQNRCNYVARFPFGLLYDFKNKEISVLPMKEAHRDLFDKYSFDTEKITNVLLEEYMEELHETVLLKPETQEILEQYFTVPESVANLPETYAVSSVDHFYTNLSNIVTSSGIVYFFVENYNAAINHSIQNYAQSNKGSVVCVEYVNEDGAEASSSLNNICFHKVAFLRADCACITSESVFYDKDCFVIQKEDRNLAIPVIVRHRKMRYSQEKLIQPFKGEISNLYKTLIDNTVHRQNSYDKSALLASLTTIKDYAINIFGQDNHIVNYCQDSIDNTLQSYRREIEEMLDGLQTRIEMGGSAVELRSTLTSLASEAEKYYPEIMGSIINPMLDQIDRLNRRPTGIQPRLFIMDTSVFLEMSDVLDRMDLVHDKVIVPNQMYEELDSKTDQHQYLELSRKAREAQLSIQRKIKHSPHFIKLVMETPLDVLPSSFDPSKNDNVMLALALDNADNERYDGVYIVSQDTRFTFAVKEYLNHAGIENIKVINLTGLLEMHES